MAEGILVCAEGLRSKPEVRTALRKWPGRMGSQHKPLKLLLKNRKSAVAVALHSTQEIMAEIAALDGKSAVVLGRIRGLE
jgi:hypothetical protein